MQALGPVAVVDPSLGRSGAHNSGFAALLVEQAGDLSQIGFWGNRDRGDAAFLGGGLLTNVPINAVFATEFRAVQGTPGGIAGNWHWIARLAREYRSTIAKIVERWPREQVRVVHHTLSWEHAAALALALDHSEDIGGHLLHLAFLMYSPGVDADGRILDASQSLKFRIAFRGLAQNNQVRLFASCAEYATAYQRLLERDEPLPIHPCFLGDWSTARDEFAESRGTTAILYLGEIKYEKRFGQLPELVGRQQKQAGTHDTMIVQFIPRPGVVPTDLIRVIDRLRSQAAEDPRIQIHEGFWSTQELRRALAGADSLFLNYDQKAYRHKTSGLIWLAAWHNVLAMIPPDTWLEREAARLGMQHRLLTPDLLTHPPKGAPACDDVYRRTLFTPFLPWIAVQV